MKHIVVRVGRVLIISSFIAAALSACGGGSGAGPSPAEKTLVTGQITAFGSPLQNGAVNAYNTAGGVCGSTTTNASGNYTLDLSGCTQPTLVLVSSAQGVDVAATLLTAGYTGLAAGSTAQANITPLTTALTAMLLGQPIQPLANYPTLIGPTASRLTWTAMQQAVTALQSALVNQVPGYVPEDPFMGELTGTAGAQILNFRIVPNGNGFALQYQEAGAYAQNITLPTLANTQTTSPSPGSVTNSSFYAGRSFIFSGQVALMRAVAATASSPSTTQTVYDSISCKGAMDLSGVVTGQCDIHDASGVSSSPMSGNLLNPSELPGVNKPMMMWRISTPYGNWVPTFSPVSLNNAVVQGVANGFSGVATFQ